MAVVQFGLTWFGYSIWLSDIFFERRAVSDKARAHFGEMVKSINRYISILH